MSVPRIDLMKLNRTAKHEVVRAAQSEVTVVILPSIQGRSLRREKAEDLAHHAVRLIRLEEKLGVGGAIKNDQLFWFGRFFVLLANRG